MKVQLNDCRWRKEFPERPSKTLPLNLAKMHQLTTRYLAKDPTSCDTANPRCTGPFSKSPPTLATPKITFPGVSVFYGREAEGRLRSSSSLWDLLSKPMMRGGVETTSLHPRRLNVMLSHEPVAFPAAHQSKILLPVTGGPHEGGRR